MSLEILKESVVSRRLDNKLYYARCRVKMLDCPGFATMCEISIRVFGVSV